MNAPFWTRRHALAAAALLPLGAATAGSPQRVLVPVDVRQDFERFLAGRDPLQLQHYGGPHARRDVAELVLLLQALALGGITERPERVAMPSVARLVRELAQAQGVCSGTTYWKEDVPSPEDFLFSRTMVADGEFVAGLYTRPARADVLAMQSLDELRRLRFVSNRHWRVDWATLLGLGIERLAHADTWEAMPRMLAAGRADVVLAPFQPTPDLALDVDGVRLVPIPGLKLGLRGTRHYLVSRRHPEGAAWLAALDKGLQQLQAQGAVLRAYQQSGFHHPAVAGWKRI
ncbi:MAG: hypothetical protein U1E77_21925 [Inhella sp.]